MDLSPDVARELVFAYTDAAERGDDDDQAYAAEQIEGFLDDTDDDTPDDVLIALLDLPLDGDTLPLLTETSARLRRRAPGVVEPLLAAAVGEGLPELGIGDVVTVAGAVGALLEAATRNPDTPPRVENALSILDAMSLGDLILGLVEVLEGHGDDRLKRAASDALVEIGPEAVDELTMSLRDRDAAPWVVDTLGEIKARASEGWRGEDEADEDDETGWSDDTDVDGDEADAAEADVDVDAVVDDDVPDDALSAEAGPGAAAPGDAVDPAAGRPPSSDRIAADYDDFLERFKRETGQT